MDTIQSKLKKLFYSLGGDADAVRETEDVNTIIDAISALDLGDKIAAGSELPAVTAEDNGDVLTVSGGEWTNAAPVTPDQELPTLPAEDGTYTLQVTVSGTTKTLAWAAVTPAAAGTD